MRGEGVQCPLCGRRVVTTEAPCECGFRFPHGYGEPTASSRPRSYTPEFEIHAAPEAIAAHIQQATERSTAIVKEIGWLEALYLRRLAGAALLCCPLCDHEWALHDPEDGKCDSHSREDGVYGPCRCGRDLAFTAAGNAARSRAALETAADRRAANSQEAPE